MPNLSKQLEKAGMVLTRLSSSVLLFCVAGYRTLGTLYFGGACRFEPSCSEYAVIAINKHKPLYAINLILKRIYRCRPGGSSGFDPVPDSEICQCHVTDVKGAYGTT